MRVRSREFNSRRALFYFAVLFVIFFCLGTIPCVVSQRSTCTLRPDIFDYTAVRRICMYLECVYAYKVPSAVLCVAILLLLLQIAAAACCCCSSPSAGWRKLMMWFIESDSSVLFLFIGTRFDSYAPLGSIVAFAASICLV